MRISSTPLCAARAAPWARSGAPSLFQLVAAECTGQTADIEIYHKNRDLLLNALRDMGYTCAQPDGAFYLFPRSLEPDAPRLLRAGQEV